MTRSPVPNRVLFMDRLQQAIGRLRRRETPAAVLFLDVDRFKLVNDSLGHEVGDEPMEEIADEHDAIEMAQRVAGMFTGRSCWPAPSTSPP